MDLKKKDNIARKCLVWRVSGKKILDYQKQMLLSSETGLSSTETKKAVEIIIFEMLIENGMTSILKNKDKLSVPKIGTFWELFVFKKTQEGILVGGKDREGAVLEEIKHIKNVAATDLQEFEDQVIEAVTQARYMPKKF